MVTKKQLKKEIEDLKGQLKEKANGLERTVGDLKEKVELMRFLREHPKGYDFCLHPALYSFVIRGASSGEERMISAKHISMRYAYGWDLKVADICEVPPIKNVDVVRETEQTYTVRIELDGAEVGETENLFLYYRVYKRTGDVEDMKDDKELWSEEEKQ